GGDASDRLPDAAEIVVYRVVQEALTNVARHADARSAEVTIERSPSYVVATIADDGRGFDVATMMGSRERGLGLFGMRERVDLVGGTLEIDSAPGSGTRVRAAVPVPRPDRPTDASVSAPPSAAVAVARS